MLTVTIKDDGARHETTTPILPGVSSADCIRLNEMQMNVTNRRIGRIPGNPTTLGAAQAHQVCLSLEHGLERLRRAVYGEPERRKQ